MTATPYQEIEAIKALKARYFRLLDTKQWDTWRGVFAEDLHLLVDGSVPVAGEDVEASFEYHTRDAFVEALSIRLKDCNTVHHGHMPEIVLTGANTATGIWAMEDIVEHANGKLHGYGHYHETYRKRDGEWRIASLHLTRIRLVYSGDYQCFP